MPLRQKPLKKDFTDLEGHTPKGLLIDASRQGKARLAKRMRLDRQRGRYRLPALQMKLHSKFTFDVDGEVNEEDTFEMRPDEVELTDDTVRNKLFFSELTEKDSFGDDGGSFTHFKTSCSDDSTNVHTVHDVEFGVLEVSGHIWALATNFSEDDVRIYDRDFVFPDDVDHSDIGPLLWRLMKPTRPVMDIGVSIVELRDLPRLVKGRLDSIKAIIGSLTNPKGLADWLLAVQFGWKPLYSDIKKLGQFAKRLDKRLQFLKTNAGKPVKGMTTWFEETQVFVLEDFVSNEDVYLSYDAIPSGTVPDSEEERHTCKLTLRITTRFKGTGKFLYFWDGKIPGDEFIRAHLGGLIVTERVAWEGMPWSWLIDWFSNVGDVLSNLREQLVDRLVATYAYSQKHVLREYTWTCSNGYYTCSLTKSFETKSRRKIDPFGLALETGLTDLQSSILAALAITRS